MANTYKLYFYTTQKGGSITPTSSQSMDFGSSSHNVTLLRLKYKKKVYEPCEILAELTIDGISRQSDVINAFLNQKVDLEVEYKTADNKTKSLIVATNYFVYKVRPVYDVKSTSSMTVELGIYSADKVMTLDKYSRAYTAKKLYTDILLKESEKFHLNDDNCTKLSSLVANHTQLLKYKVDETVSQTSGVTESEVAYSDELRIPYIVQYNESFYQFMVRASNRFGEFLYFENGKLNLGMLPSDTNYYKRDADGNIVQENGEDAVIDWASDAASYAVKRRYYESVLSEGIEVEDRAYNYADHEKSSESNSYVPSSDKRYNIDSVPADEWTDMKLNKKFYTTQADLWQEELRYHALGLTFRNLGFTALSDFLLHLLADSALQAWTYATFGHNFNHTMMHDNYDPVKDNDDQVSDPNFKPFATYDGSSHLGTNLKKLGSDGDIINFTNLFYPLIRKKEKEIGEQAVWLDFGDTFTPIKLGDKMRVDGTDYVVIQIEGSYDVLQKYDVVKETKDGEDSYHVKMKDVVEDKLLVSAIPVLTLDSSTVDSRSLSESSGNDAWTTTLPVPPALPDVLIRDARPQVAFVVQTTDPESLGRIRVRYPWQHKEDDATPWIRVTLPYATSGGCVNFMPSVGDEVMVGYEHGNIDHPYAMGYLTAPFVNNNWADSLPFDHWGGQHGIKVKTGHHLTFTDGANSASMVASLFGPLSCLKSIWPIGVWWDAPTGLQDLGGGFELADRYGFYKIKGSTDDRSVTIESPAGTVEVNAFQGITISAPNGDVNITGKNVNISANNNLSITSGETIKDRFYYRKEWEGSKALAMGTSFLAGGLDVLKSFAMDKLLDVSFLRCVLEVILRPVDGTLQIKSYTFIQMEAGSGETELPNDSLRNGEDNLKDQNALTKINTDLHKLCNTVSLAKSNVEALINPIKTSYEKLILATAAFNEISGATGDNKDQLAIKFKDIITYACGTNGGTALKSESTQFKFNNQGLDLKLENNTFADPAPQNQKSTEYEEWKKKKQAKEAADRSDSEKTAKRNEIVKRSEAVRSEAYTLVKEIKKWTELAAIDKGKFNDNDVDADDLKDKIKAIGFAGTNIKSLDDLKDGNYDIGDIKTLPKGFWEAQKQAVTRYAVYQYVIAKATNYDYFVGKQNISNAKDAYGDTEWRKFVKSIKVDDTPAWKIRKKAVLDKTIFKIRDEFTETPRKWKNGYVGQILFSQGEKTATFDKNHNLVSTYNQNTNSANLSSLYAELIKL